ncbi:formimidoylglutamase [Hymenobacter crusticola]|uniref:Formiminoglutamase n=1 Tax=Hymenobacter crusticola TaxID=1770526 RepID=A0A243WDB8_9BACT|nr:formimidoylglutamase [Hymenobacter crusticola]OUJ73668.1 formiminoglutamase [Hymenobacter crusticola]
MNLALFFDPLREELIASGSTLSTLAICASPFVDNFPDWRNADLAIIGLDEWRGSALGTPVIQGADEVRRRFYQLQKGTSSIRLVDLGNLRPGLTLEDTYLRLREIVAMLLEHNTIPLLLGGSPDLDYGQFLAYETLERPISFAAVDSRVDMAEHASAPQEEAHLRRMLMYEPNFLFNFVQLAYQQYLVAPDVLVALEKLHFEKLRLGEIHADVRQAELLLRQADFVSFDVAALRWLSAPAYQPANPFGLTGEEAAQLAWYAGHSDQLSSFGLYGYRPDHDDHGLAAMTLATMLWYFIEGFYHRSKDKDFQSPHFTRYLVSLSDTPETVVFYKANYGEKWWVEVESMANSTLKRLVPCTYEEYQEAVQGILPSRWYLTQALLG